MIFHKRQLDDECGIPYGKTIWMFSHNLRLEQISKRPSVAPTLVRSQEKSLAAYGSVEDHFFCLVVHSLLFDGYDDGSVLEFHFCQGSI